MQHHSKTALAAASFALYSLPSLAQSNASLINVLPGNDTQRAQQQRIDANFTNGALGDALDHDAPRAVSGDLAHLPAQSPCFEIRKVHINNNPFRAVDRLVEPVVGQCAGTEALKIVQDSVANALINAGYVTTRVTVPEQSLASGTLELDVVPGRIGAIRTQGEAIGDLARALPSAEGAVLSQRAVDQALENIRRLPSQADARFDIAPGAVTGESDLVLYAGTGKRWRAMAGYDNAGQRATGKNELFGALAFDSPFFQYDQLQVSGLTNANYAAPGKGANQASASYSVPFGYAMLTLDAYRASYLQTQALTSGTAQFTGEQKGAGIKLSGVVQRDAKSRTELRARFYRALNHHYVNNTWIDVQDRDVYGYELGASHRRYFGRVQVDASLGWRDTLPGISRQPGYALGDSAFNGREQLVSTSLTVLSPLRIGERNFSYQFAWYSQNARTRVTAPDYFTIGTRYAVRGFDQEATLAAESGWTVSNELDWYAPTSYGVQALYAGLDAGRVHGPTARYLAGNTLVGMVAGARGSLIAKNSVSAAVNYDVSVGWPLYKPKAFPSRSPTLLVQISTLI
ncbi:ShlB/FhaC/HecB family hemolysin secretion/activation protein [Paraburkholderia sp. MPAMCS5]|uniref:ShlB/FhaC/HecB family hemolysin secretion/activation protein n=1 Tax=Paraburkholderia sp. MPAMCS5 TaxID=3112563 RepID=UPI002E184EC7|nr:ShlB/FhaC/HecB family hemolysin secretion/activation protein [Paraburkholderia sp. MPAMCS5]